MREKEESELRAKIIDKLDEYGDSFLSEGSDNKIKRKKKGHKKSAEPNTELKPIGRNKKKSKKLVGNTIPELDLDKEGFSSDDELSESETPFTGERRHLEDLKKTLGLSSLDLIPSKGDKDHNLPSASIPLKNKREPEVVVFLDPAKRKQNLAQDSKPTTSRGKGKGVKRMAEVERDAEDDFDMKMAKRDVLMLGIKGLDKIDKEKARVDLAITLGAQPPKRAFVNYRLLQEEKRIEKSIAVTKINEARESDGLVSKSNMRKRRQRDKNDIGFIDGQVGEYKSGVQVLKKKDLKKLTSPRGSDRGNRGGRGRRGR